jgi:hypothetical protein
MPIRINLKELFPADPQEITVDKINFNFNKLLELGIGDDGPIGQSGIRGAAGPSGNLGGQGLRGSTWYVDSVANPNSLTITDLIAGDFYLNSTTFAVWQYDGTQWNFLFDLTQIINNYLAASPSPFQRGIGIGSPDDDRFIRFARRDAFPNDQLGSSVSTNDTLFLNNFDEDSISPFVFGPALSPSGTQIPTSDLYNSLLSIAVDGRTPLTQRRYHLELGDLYVDGSDPKLTTKDENLKVRFSKEASSGYDPGILYYGLASFSLDTHSNLPGRVSNGVFEWITPKYSALDSIDAKNITLIGSKYGLREFTSSDLKADGLLFINDGGKISNIGIAEDFLIPNYPSNTGYVINNATKSYLMLDPVDGIEAIYLDNTVYQDGGNIIQLGTSEPRLNILYTLSNSSNSQYIAACIQGNTLFSMISQLPSNISSEGRYVETTIQNPNSGAGTPVSQTYSSNSSATPTGSGVADLCAIGKNLYIVNNHPSVSFGSGACHFQILKIDESPNRARPALASKLFDNDLARAYRISPRGNHMIVATNALQYDSGFSTFDQRGTLAAIDVSDSNSPKIVESYQDTTLNTRHAFLDLAVVDDFVYALTWEQSYPDSGLVNLDLRVRVKQFDLTLLDSNEPTIIFKSNSPNFFESLNIPSSGANIVYQNQNKKGAICANKHWVYAGYSKTSSSHQIMICRLVENSNNPIQFNLFPILTLTSGLKEITDIECIGNTLFVLISPDNANGNSALIKLDISNPATPVKIWEKEILYYSDKFIVSGKNIYVFSRSGVTTGRVYSIDFDGFYTTGAHIESLRSEKINITQDLLVGGSANIDNSLNVGGNSIFNKDLSVGKSLKIGESISLSYSTINNVAPAPARNIIPNNNSTFIHLSGLDSTTQEVELPDARLAPIGKLLSISNSRPTSATMVPSFGNTLEQIAGGTLAGYPVPTNGWIDFINLGGGVWKIVRKG